jgi:hypothetical protein
MTVDRDAKEKQRESKEVRVPSAAYIMTTDFHFRANGKGPGSENFLE